MLGGLLALGVGGGVIYYLYTNGFFNGGGGGGNQNCTEGNTSCQGSDLYKCVNDNWVLYQQNSPQCSSGSDTFNINGQTMYTIEQQIQGPVANAKVDAKNRDTGIHYIQYSDSNGDFQLANLPPGIYDLTTSKTGYVTYSASYIEWTQEWGYIGGGTYDIGYMYTTIEKLMSFTLDWDWDGTNHVLSKDFAIDPPSTLNRITGTVKVNSCSAEIYRALDVWGYPVYGDAFKICSKGWGDPTIQIAESFSDRQLNKVSLWAKCWWPGEEYGLENINLVIKREL